MVAYDQSVRENPSTRAATTGGISPFEIEVEIEAEIEAQIEVEGSVSAPVVRSTTALGRDRERRGFLPVRGGVDGGSSVIIASNTAAVVNATAVAANTADAKFTRAAMFPIGTIAARCARRT